jgi:hypothetical protein
MPKDQDFSVVFLYLVPAVVLEVRASESSLPWKGDSYSDF